MRIGDVYMMMFSGEGNEQKGFRPGVVFSNNVGNVHSPNIIALPMTSSIKKTAQPTHVVISRTDSGLRADSMVLCENPERMSKARIGRYVTTLNDSYIQSIAIASMLATSAIAYIDLESLMNTWKVAKSLNS